MAAMRNKEIQLVEKAGSGNLQAFEELVQTYDKRILSMAYQLMGNAEDAEDLYQEVFIKVFQNISRFRFDSDFFTWLYRIVINTSISHRRKKSRHQHQSFEVIDQQPDAGTWMPVDDNPGPDKITMNREVKEKIESIIAQLPMMLRTVFVLRFQQDFKIKEIADIIGCSEGTVKNYIFRCTRKMRKNLTPYLETNG